MFRPDFDFDQIARAVLEDVRVSVRGWHAGRPLDEVAFMNHLTGRLRRRRRGCDIGTRPRVSVSCDLAMLHRQGESQTDKFGADLAITVYAYPGGFTKTALFQIKRGSEWSVRVERNQLEQAALDGRILDRSFVLGIASDTEAIRIRGVGKLLDAFPDNQESIGCDVVEWDSVAFWLYEWLSCRLGPESDLSDENCIESLLEQHQTVGGAPPWERTHRLLGRKQREDWAPARAWLRFGLNKKH